MKGNKKLRTSCKSIRNAMTVKNGALSHWFHMAVSKQIYTPCLYRYGLEDKCHRTNLNPVVLIEHNDTKKMMSRFNGVEVNLVDWENVMFETTSLQREILILVFDS